MTPSMMPRNWPKSKLDAILASAPTVVICATSDDAHALRRALYRRDTLRAFVITVHDSIVTLTRPNVPQMEIHNALLDD